MVPFKNELLLLYMYYYYYQSRKLIYYCVMMTLRSNCLIYQQNSETVV